jgi:hypothetical protein
MFLKNITVSDLPILCISVPFCYNKNLPFWLPDSYKHRAYLKRQAFNDIWWRTKLLLSIRVHMSMARPLRPPWHSCVLTRHYNSAARSVTIKATYCIIIMSYMDTLIHDLASSNVAYNSGQVRELML